LTATPPINGGGYDAIIDGAPRVGKAGHGSAVLLPVNEGKEQLLKALTREILQNGHPIIQK